MWVCTYARSCDWNGEACVGEKKNYKKIKRCMCIKICSFSKIFGKVDMYEYMCVIKTSSPKYKQLIVTICLKTISYINIY